MLNTLNLLDNTLDISCSLLTLVLAAGFDDDGVSWTLATYSSKTPIAISSEMAISETSTSPLKKRSQFDESVGCLASRRLPLSEVCLVPAPRVLVLTAAAVEAVDDDDPVPTSRMITRGGRMKAWPLCRPT